MRCGERFDQKTILDVGAMATNYLKGVELGSRSSGSSGLDRSTSVPPTRRALSLGPAGGGPHRPDGRIQAKAMATMGPAGSWVTGSLRPPEPVGPPPPGHTAPPLPPPTTPHPDVAAAIPAPATPPATPSTPAAPSIPRRSRRLSRRRQWCSRPDPEPVSPGQPKSGPREATDDLSYWRDRCIRIEAIHGVKEESWQQQKERLEAESRVDKQTITELNTENKKLLSRAITAETELDVERKRRRRLERDSSLGTEGTLRSFDSEESDRARSVSPWLWKPCSLGTADQGRAW